MKFYLKTYGCQMNERDSEVAAAILAEHGHEQVHNEKDADLLLFNTCSVREQAELKAIGKIGFIRKLKKRSPNLFIGILGCMVQNHKEKLFEQLPHVDFILGTDQLSRLPEVVDDEIIKRQHIALLDQDSLTPERLSSRLPSQNKFSAFVAVMRGCNRFCSYCIVPYVRGREKSRPTAAIKKEVESLVANGVREITLLGQNVAAFGLDGAAPESLSDHSPFGELMEELSKIPELLRIRFASPHPAYFNSRLIQAIIETPKVCNNVHLPLQSGSDRILKLMNRPYSVKNYLKIISELKSGRSGITFSTDIIVGFPSESEADFQATRDVMNEVAYDNAYIFKYSPREGTKSAKLNDDVPKEIKEDRNHILLQDLENRTDQHNKETVGKKIEVLVEGPSKRNSARWSGRSSTNKVVIFQPEPQIKPGDLLTINISRATSMTLYGEIYPKISI